MEASTDLPIRARLAGKEKPSKQSKQPKTKPVTPTVNDPNAMFKVGFLSDVYQEKPIGSPGVDRIVTRFPPEPNGYLHIGHSKAIAVNFGFAKYHGGECYLRFDDTNPKGEEERYYNNAKEIIRWLGFKPVKVTHTSDYFDQLYDLAEALILKDRAYMCHCTGRSSFYFTSAPPF
jgi:glutaminyl-tRNA synthetase